MSPFLRRRIRPERDGGYEVRLPRPERDLVSGLPDQLDALLAARGAVDPEVAGAMAEGVRDRLRAGAGVATTGVAGPDPADGKPPGTVHIAVSAAAGPVIRTLDLAGTRDEVRRDTVQQSLRLLWDVLWEESP